MKGPSEDPKPDGQRQPIGELSRCCSIGFLADQCSGLNCAEAAREPANNEQRVSKKTWQTGIGRLLQVIIVHHARHLRFRPLNLVVRNRKRAGSGAKERVLFGDLQRRPPIIETGANTGRTLSKKARVFPEESCNPQSENRRDQNDLELAFPWHEQ